MTANASVMVERRSFERLRLRLSAILVLTLSFTTVWSAGVPVDSVVSGYNDDDAGVETMLAAMVRVYVRPRVASCTTLVTD